MTSGGKAIRASFSDTSASPFAPLRALNPGERHDIADEVASISAALGDFPESAIVHLRILDEQQTHDWELCSGPAPASEQVPPVPDVRLVIRRDTLRSILNGSLAPFDALFDGKVGVGGDTTLAKRLVEHLSDPSVPYVPPCQG